MSYINNGGKCFMSRKPNILVVGSINMDLVLRMPRVPVAGESFIGNEYNFIPGGKGSNQAVAAALLEANVDFVGKVGSDANGLRLKELLVQKNISTKYFLVDEASQTGLAVVMLEADGMNRIIVFPGANMEIVKEDIQRAFEKDYDAVIVQFEVPQEIVIETCRLAMQKNIPVTVDAGPAQDFPLEQIKGIDILSPNETEAFAMCGVKIDTFEQAEEAAKILKKRADARIIVIKMGKKGAFLYSDDMTGVYPVPDVKVVDSTAAGDAFTAAMTIEYISSGDIGRAIRFANVVGTITVTRLGAQPSLPTLTEVEKFAREKNLAW
jgi:ribokinase